MKQALIISIVLHVAVFSHAARPNQQTKVSLQKQTSDPAPQKDAFEILWRTCKRKNIFAYKYMYVEYRHLIPAPVDQTSAGAWVYKHP